MVPLGTLTTGHRLTKGSHATTWSNATTGSNASSGHKGQYQVTHGDPDHAGCVHMLNWSIKVEAPNFRMTSATLSDLTSYLSSSSFMALEYQQNNRNQLLHCKPFMNPTKSIKL